MCPSNPQSILILPDSENYTVKKTKTRTVPRLRALTMSSPSIPFIFTRQLSVYLQGALTYLKWEFVHWYLIVKNTDIKITKSHYNKVVFQIPKLKIFLYSCIAGFILPGH